MLPACAGFIIEVAMMRACLALVPVLLGCAAGCVPLVYAYPSVSLVPALNLGPAHDNIYAFRVDIADDDSSSHFAKPGHYRFRQVHIAPHGSVVAQGKVGMDSGFYWNLFVTCFAQKTDHTIRLRLYRPGFNLIEIQSWQGDASLEWQAVPGPAGQEQVVDALLRPTGKGTWPGRDQVWGFGQLDPGSASSEHRHALLFAAAEYQRLAEDMEIDAADGAEACNRCHAKAKFLRELAVK